MKTQIRRFNVLGIERFRNALNEIRDGNANEIPPALLVDTYSCEIVHTDVKIEQKIFDKKEEMISYLFDKIYQVSSKGHLYDVGIWSWLAAFYFDSICPKMKDGERKVREDSRYILNAEEWNKYYRHLLASPTRLFKELGPQAKIYLAGKPDVPGDLFEQLASRQEIAACKGIVEAATLLYWDREMEKIKRGARNKKGPGVLRRFVKSTIPQFQMTYDLNSMTGKDILKLLPNEYSDWMS